MLQQLARRLFPLLALACLGYFAWPTPTAEAGNPNPANAGYNIATFMVQNLAVTASSDAGLIVHAWCAPRAVEITRCRAIPNVAGVGVRQNSTIEIWNNGASQVGPGDAGAVVLGTVTSNNDGGTAGKFRVGIPVDFTLSSARLYDGGPTLVNRVNKNDCLYAYYHGGFLAGVAGGADTIGANTRIECEYRDQDTVRMR